MWKWVIAGMTVLLTVGLVLLVMVGKDVESGKVISPLAGGQEKKVEEEVRVLERYEFEQLRQREAVASKIELGELVKEEKKYRGYKFWYTSEGRRISGLAHIPEGEGKFPVVVMIRGWVDVAVYETGMGTERAGEVYASNGLVTVAPDFLGYGDSDDPPNDVWEERFLRPVAVMDLIASLGSLEMVDRDNIFLWGHSNGGLVSLIVLELTGGDYPTSLWAPVTQFFPYDILYYTWEYDDKGKALRKNLADFEADYDVDKYSFDEHLEWIEAPLQLHQGTGDMYIPVVWSDGIVERLEREGVEVEYYKYPGADHNMRGAWDTVVARDVRFYREKVKN